MFDDIYPARLELAGFELALSLEWAIGLLRDSYPFGRGSRTGPVVFHCMNATSFPVTSRTTFSKTSCRTRVCL